MSSIYGFAYAYIYAREVEGVPRDQIDKTRLPGTIFQHVLFVTLSCACSIAVGILLPLEKATNIVGLAADMGSLFVSLHTSFKCCDVPYFICCYQVVINPFSSFHTIPLDVCWSFICCTSSHER